jgi:hypothetical protein
MMGCAAEGDTEKQIEGTGLLSGLIKLIKRSW